MKKILSLVILVLSFNFVAISCNDDDDDNRDGNTITEVYEITASFKFDSKLGWTIQNALNPRIYTSDNLLIYRLSGTNNQNQDVWQLLPRTNYLNSDVNNDGIEDAIDYDFDFSISDFVIYAGGNYNLSLIPQLISNQTFRIVIIPGSFEATKTATPLVDYNDYNAVIKYYNIDESKMKQIIPKK